MTEPQCNCGEFYPEMCMPDLPPLYTVVMVDTWSVFLRAGEIHRHPRWRPAIRQYYPHDGDRFRGNMWDFVDAARDWAWIPQMPEWRVT